MTASQVMQKHPTVLRPTDVIRTAADYIMRNRFRSIPVVDDEGRFVAVFGGNCLLKMVLPKAVIMEKGLDNLGFIHETLHDLHERLREVEEHPISACMQKDTQTVAPDTPLMEVLWQLYKTKTSIPVVEPDSGRLVGMISYWDVGEKILSA